MTTNQTIDGVLVPRELIEWLVTPGNVMDLGGRLEELRALLDAERCTSCDGSGDLIDLTGEWRGYCVCPAGVALKNKPAAPAGRAGCGHVCGWIGAYEGRMRDRL